MKSRNLLLGLAAIALGLVPAAAQQDSKVFYAWAPKPVPLTQWKAPNKPIWRLSEIMAAHKGQSDWVQPIVRDQDYAADYISMGAGQKTRPQLWADDPVFWYIASGQVRFHIEGQEPFVAGKGFLVQAPYRNVYWMETVGNEPSVRFEVVHAGRTPLYPAAKGDTGPAPKVKGKEYILSSYRTPPLPYTDKILPYLDFWGDFVKRPPVRGNTRFVADDDNFMNVIRGKGMPTPPDSNKGHFHIDYNEFWVIAEGTMDYKMEGMKVFTADVGEVLFAPQVRWHRASWAGNGMATRIAINPRREGLQSYDPEAAQ